MFATSSCCLGWLGWELPEQCCVGDCVVECALATDGDRLHSRDGGEPGGFMCAGQVERIECVRQCTGLGGVVWGCCMVDLLGDNGLVAQQRGAVEDHGHFGDVEMRRGNTSLHALGRQHGAHDRVDVVLAHSVALLVRHDTDVEVVACLHILGDEEPVTVAPDCLVHELAHEHEL